MLKIIQVMKRFKQHYILMVGCMLLTVLAMAQDKQLIQIKTFDEKLSYLQHIELVLNDKIELKTNERGISFIEVNAAEIPFRSVHVKNEGLEVASWNLSKGTIEIIVRKKNYNLVTVTILNQNQVPLDRQDVIFTGSRKINVKTSSSGTLQLPLSLDERITSPGQFFIKGYQSIRLATVTGGYTLVVEKITPVEVKQPLRRSIEAKIASLDTVQTLNEFYQIVRDLPMDELNDLQKRKVDDKFNELISGMEVADSLSGTHVVSITDSLAITDDIKHLIDQTIAERDQLEGQRAEFDSRISALDRKLSGGIANMDAATREQVLNDIVSLESLLLNNKRQFDKNQADYQLIINSLKERYFNIRILEEKLSVSELLREQEQKEFRKQVIFGSIALIIFLILIILLARFSNKMSKQQKALTRANNEIRKINETLEERVANRTKLLQEANLELDTFLYRASHDLRTPVASIEGIANLAEHLSRDEFVEMIKASTEKMNNLLKNLSVISGINLPVEATSVKVAPLLKNIEDSFRNVLMHNQVKATWHCAESIEIHTYEVFLEVVITKLVENAIFFSLLKKEASPEIAIRITPHDNGIVLVVEDNGIGICESVRPRITEMFFRGHEKSKGSGLGLYMVSRCLQLMKGTLSIESKEAHYTRITIQLPG